MSRDGVHPDDMPDELDAFLDDLRSAAAAAPAPVVGHALATLFREGTAPTAAPRRRVAVRAIVAGAVAAVAFGGLGVAGALPGPVQQRVADVVDHVGVHLPDDRPAATTTTSTVPPATTTSTTVRPAAVPPTVRPAAPPTTVDDHGGTGRGDDSGGGGSGSGDDQSGDHGTGSDDQQGQPGNGSGGKDRGTGRNPDDVGDVHVDEGSSSGHGDGGSR